MRKMIFFKRGYSCLEDTLPGPNSARLVRFSNHMRLFLHRKSFFPDAPDNYRGDQIAKIK